MAETLASLVANAGLIFSSAGFAEPRRRARQVIAGALGLTPADLLMRSEHRLEHSETQRVQDCIDRMARGEPLSRVLGKREFWGLDFELAAETLDPRPDSETLIEAVLARVERDAPLRLLDLGTGSGCLLLALLAELPAAIGLGVDISERAVAIARRNALSLGLADRSLFVVSDWGSAIIERFDVVVANPPYIATAMLAQLPSDVRCYDPPAALDGGADGLAAYRSIVPQLHQLLVPTGLFVAEVGQGQAADVVTILSSHTLACAGMERDLRGIERCVVAQTVTENTSESASPDKKTWNGPP